MKATAEHLHDYPNEHRAQLIDELAGWIRIPSIAGVPGHEVDLARDDVRAAEHDQRDQTPPFEAALRQGRIYGRGASDAVLAAAMLADAMRDGFDRGSDAA